jgi:hypothetical protein
MVCCLNLVGQTSTFSTPPLSLIGDSLIYHIMGHLYPLLGHGGWEANKERRSTQTTGVFGADTVKEF